MILEQAGAPGRAEGADADELGGSSDSLRTPADETAQNSVEARPDRPARRRQAREAVKIARELARFGVPIFVARPALDSAGEWDPRGGSGGTGYVLPAGWQQTTADPAVVDTWRPGDALCAVMGGPVDGLDLDTRSGGQETADGLAAAGMWPAVVGSQVTPSGGRHDLVNALRVGSRDGLRPGLDVKGGRPDGTGRGFIFLAPTVKLSKVDGQVRPYRWTSPPMLEELDPADDSGAAIAEMITNARGPTRRDSRVSSAAVPIYTGPAFADLSADEQRRLTRYTRKILRDELARLDALERPWRGGAGWDRTTHHVCCQVLDIADSGWSPLTTERAIELVREHAPSNDRWGALEVQRKIRSAMGRATAGLGRPYPPDPGADEDWITGPDVRQPGRSPSTVADRTGPQGGVSDALAVGEQHRGQARMAYRLAEAYAGRLMHVAGLGWFRWDGKRWAQDDRGAAKRAVLAVLRKALAESVGGDESLRSDVRRCESSAGVAGVLDLASALQPFARTVDDLDADPYLLNTASGTLDLRTLELRPHDPADRITKITNAAYVLGATGATWAAFLERVLPDREVRAFLQRLAGVGLLGIVVEHVLAILIGTGANGKGTFYKALGHALGDYATVAEPELFMHREGAHPTGEMDLLGVRWVVVSESDRDRRLAEATMKRLTGGDVIKARRMRQDFVKFTPSHTPILVTNHLPAVSGDDPAVWRRLRVVPFDVVIPDHERDGHLDERLELDADAILAWAVAGYTDYCRRGLAGETA